MPALIFFSYCALCSNLLDVYSSSVGVHCYGSCLPDLIMLLQSA